MNYGNKRVIRSDGSIFIESKPWMMDLRNNLKDYADSIKKVDPQRYCIEYALHISSFASTNGYPEQILFSQKYEELVGKSIIK